MSNSSKFQSLLLSIGLIFFFNIGSYAQEDSSAIKLNTDLNGAYSIVSIENNGDTRHVAMKFKAGNLTSLVINGVEIPEQEWENYNTIINESVKYIEPEKHEKYKYEGVYKFENQIRQELRNMDRSIREMEIEKRMNEFYNNDLKEWIDAFERELNESRFAQDMEEILDELLLDLDQFLQERKEYMNEQAKSDNEKAEREKR